MIIFLLGFLGGVAAFAVLAAGALYALHKAAQRRMMNDPAIKIPRPYPEA